MNGVAISGSFVISPCHLYLNDSLSHHPIGNRLVVCPDGSIQILPKGIGEIIGERILRPLFDTSYPFLKRSFQLIQRGVGSLHSVVSKINILAIANAQPFPADFQRDCNGVLITSDEVNQDLLKFSATERVSDVLELISYLLKPLTDISLFREKDFQHIVKNFLETKIPHEKLYAHLDEFLKMLNNYLEQSKGVTLSEKFQNAGLRVEQDIIKVVNYLKQNMEVISIEIKAGKESALPNELTNNNQKYVFSKLMTFLNLVELYKMSRGHPNTFEKVISHLHLTGLFKSKSLQVEPAEFKVFDDILKNVKNLHILNEFEFTRGMASRKIVSALKAFIQPATLNDKQEEALNKNIKQALDTIVEERIAKELIEFIHSFERYVKNEHDLTTFVNDASHIFLYLIPVTYSLIVPKWDFHDWEQQRE